MKESQDVGLAQQKLSEAQNELKALNDELAEEVAALGATDAAAVEVQTIEVKPKRGGVDIRLVALAWTPVEQRPPVFRPASEIISPTWATNHVEPFRSSRATG